jgi:hypothetical protein
MINSIEKEILFDILNNPSDTFYENVLSDFLDEQRIDHDFRKPLHNNTVTELKPYQEKCLAVWRNYWTNISLCTKPTDEVKAEQYFFDIYKQLDFPIPKSITWLDNPIEMCRQLSNWAMDRVGNQVWDQLWNQVSNQVWDQVDNQIWNQVRNQVFDQVWKKVRDQAVGDQVWNELSYQIVDYLYCGQHDINLLAFYSYCMQVLRIEAHKSLVPFMLLAQEVNWWWIPPTKQNICVVRKPKEFVLKDNKLVKITFQDNYTIT